MVEKPSSDKDNLVFRVTDIWEARTRLRNLILRTPLIFSSALSQRTGCQVYLKMECWQLCGCFKVRGAINKVASLTDAEKSRGLVTASSGNHGIALAYAAKIFDQPPPIIFLPEGADATKVGKMEALGARIVFHGKVFLDAYDRALQYVAETGAVFVHSHAQPSIMAGQGTIGLEIMEDLPDAEAILVPIGGGGLISGIATAVKAISESTKIIGVEPTAAPAAYLSLRDGICYERIEVKPSLADGLLGGFGRLPFEVSRNLITEVMLVEEDEIAQAMRVFQQDEQLMVEGASSVGLAALLSGKLDLRGQKVVLVLTSRNIDTDRFNRVVCHNFGG
jgi:threonine dehydratase